MKSETKEIIEDVRTYLEYQKMMGIAEVPKSACHCEEPTGATKQSHGSNRVREIAAPPPVAPATTTLAGRRNDTKLSSIRAEIGNCQRCKLCKGRTNIVFGVGNPQAELMFIGEGPGADEDAQGEPFVGRAGQLLTKIIEAMGLKRGDVYIGNVIKCRPPNNRNPEPDEIDACMTFILKQIAAIRPKIIICLGAVAAKAMLKTEVPISRLRGKLLDWPPDTSEMFGLWNVNELPKFKLIPTYHPAFLLRNPAMKRPVWEDMQKVMAELKR